MDTQYIKRYSNQEEMCNTISHGLGAGFSVIATIVMIYISITMDQPLYLMTSIIYGGSLIMLYTMSTLYHATAAPRAKEVLRIFDHCSIFLLIAGTYTPLTMIILGDSIGPYLFWFNWAAAIIGIILNVISVERFKVFSMICYVVMGWSVVFTIEPLIASIDAGGLVLLVLGGLCYTGGLVFYRQGRTKPYMHFVWHIFVLMGSIFHFITILNYVMI